ncbi:hypothetical protein IEQ34_020924 [Dendrobium chrysotoxum]|uniref:Uncharacterized protein n=1 Tax=Dendrobium chrysotoxum TaxID=161865 RepID=A0AAV7G3F3_DENCH|nr:hypothetical protein IEQ34_020924 [Dendrobium chrysotoxum]
MHESDHSPHHLVDSVLSTYSNAPSYQCRRHSNGEMSLLVGDWYKAGHKSLRQGFDSGKPLSFPDGILNNVIPQSYFFTRDKGKTYLFRISNVGLSLSFNFRMEGHKMKVVEIEGSHTIQNTYETLDVHVGQSIAVLVTLDQPPKDYYIVATSYFTRTVLTETAVLHYSNSKSPIFGLIPAPSIDNYHWSMLQARTFKWNLTANAARTNPQGSYKYGSIKRTRSLNFVSSAPMINGKLHYAVNGVSFIVPDTPLKHADNFASVFTWDSILVAPTNGPIVLGTPVLRTNFHDFIEIIFQNIENTMQSWHLDGYSLWVVGYGNGQWSINFLFLISNIRIWIPFHRLKIVENKAIQSQAQKFHSQLDYPLRLMVPDSSYGRRMMQSILLKILLRHK